jgi:hypothetical protein
MFGTEHNADEGLAQSARPGGPPKFAPGGQETLAGVSAMRARMDNQAESAERLMVIRLPVNYRLLSLLVDKIPLQ